MDWIKMSEKRPPDNTWVLVADPNDYQKPWEIMRYLGVMTNTRYILNSELNERVSEEYEYPAWTSGHGDILSEDPVAWMPMPEPYEEEDIDKALMPLIEEGYVPDIQTKVED